MIPSHPYPVSPADRALINHHIAETGVIFVPRGVSGINIEQEISAASWRPWHDGQSKTLRDRYSKQAARYRRLIDEGKSVREIASTIGVKVGSVYSALRRLRISTPKIEAAP